MANHDTTETVITSDVEINGTIKTSGSIEFNGKLEGDLHSGGHAVIGQGARIKGHLSVESARVSGDVAGNVTAKERVELLASAKVSGDIKAKRLKVEDGVTFVGRSDVNPSGASVSPSMSSPPPSSAPAMPPKPGEAGGEDKPPLVGRK